MIMRLAQKIAEATDRTPVDVLAEARIAVQAEINYRKMYEALNEPTDES